MISVELREDGKIIVNGNCSTVSREEKGCIQTDRRLWNKVECIGFTFLRADSFDEKFGEPPYCKPEKHHNETQIIREQESRAKEQARLIDHYRKHIAAMIFAAGLPDKSVALTTVIQWGRDALEEGKEV